MAVTGRSVKLCLPDEVYAGVEDAARRSGRPVAEVAAEMLDEAVRMRRVPGIVFADGTRGRVARVGGTGLDVWEIIGEYRAVGNDWEQLRAGYPWLSEHQLQAALTYAQVYPAEIEARLQREAYWTPEVVWSTYPFTRPPGR